MGGRRAGLESALRAAIREGRLAAGTLLPSTRGLAQESGLSRGTVSAAYDQLAEEGYLTIRPGSGTRVADVPPHTPAAARDGIRQAPPLHDLRPGLPDVSTFPTRAWLAATRRVLDRARRDVFCAGDPQGRIELRTALAGYLGRTRGVLTTPDRIVITSGYYQAVGLLCRVLLATGVRVAAVEDPGHNVYRAAIQRAGLTTLPLLVDAHGARVETLTNQAGTHNAPVETTDQAGAYGGRIETPAKQVAPNDARTKPPNHQNGSNTPAEPVHEAVSDQAGVAFVTPSHHYPTGVPLHPSRRQALCAWARDTGGLIVEDDYDGEFRYDRQPVGALQGMAPEHVVYCGTASKTLSPALRLAWMVLPPHLVAPVVEAKEEADLYTEALGQLVLADLIDTHAYDRHVRAARLRYRRRRRVLLDRLAGFPRLTAHGVPAGLHVLVTLPADGPGEQRMLAECSGRGLAVRGLTELHVDPAGRPEGLLVGFAAPAERAYPAALDVLSEVLAGTVGRPAAGCPRPQAG